MKIKYIVIIAVTIVIVPILLNIFLGASNPLSNIEVVGSEVDWLAFYASYIGGLLTALIGFITLYKEAKRNRLLLEIRSKEDALKELKLALTERVGMFNYNKVTEIALFSYDKTMYSTIQRELNQYYYLLTSKANAWGCIYESSTQLEVVHFKEVYNNCWNLFKERINCITECIFDLAREDCQVERIKIIERIDSVLKNSDYVNSQIQKFYNAAQAWISAEEREIVQLKAKL